MVQKTPRSFPGLSGRVSQASDTASSFLKTVKFPVFSQVAAGPIYSAQICVAEKLLMVLESRGFGATFTKRIESVAVFLAQIFTFQDKFSPKIRPSFLFFSL